MTCEEILAHGLGPLPRSGHISVRALTIRVDLDDEDLEGLRAERIDWDEAA